MQVRSIRGRGGGGAGAGPYFFVAAYFFLELKYRIIIETPSTFWEDEKKCSENKEINSEIEVTVDIRIDICMLD